jgi:hypothetical protein
MRVPRRWLLAIALAFVAPALLRQSLLLDGLRTFE